MRRIVTLLLLVAYVQCSHVKENKWDSIIDKVNSARSTWTAGHNFPSSTTPESLRPLLGATLDEKSGPRKKELFKISYSKPIPKEFDARKEWSQCKSISQIRDQGNCGSCWAAAAAEVFTDRICVATRGKKNPKLSIEDLLTCCNDCGHGCDGGSTWFAWNHFEKYGIVTGGDYHSNEGCKPYSFEPCEHHVNGSRPKCQDLGELGTPPCQFKCSNKSYHRSYNQDKYKAQEFYVFFSNETEELQRDILQHGPVEASFRVFEDFYAYKTGVYQHITGKSLGGHAVKIIGWGEENNVPYWLVANSWNTDWGDNGYFKIRRGNNECSFEGFVVAGTVSAHNL